MPSRISTAEIALKFLQLYFAKLSHSHYFIVLTFYIYFL